MRSSTLLETPGPTEDQLSRFRTDLAYYSAAALKIRTKAAELRWLMLNEPQRIVHRQIAEQRAATGRVRVLILKARQEGISTYVGARYFRSVTLWSQMHALVVAHKLEAAGELFGIYDRYNEHLAPELAPGKVSAQRKRELSFANGSQVKVETAGDPQAGRALTIQRLHASELAFWPHAEDTWTSLLQAVPRRDSEVIVESTANGVGNLFHRLWTEAEAGASDWLPIFLPWWVHDEYAIECSHAEREEIARSADPFEREAQSGGIAWQAAQHRLSPEQLAWRRATIRKNFSGDVRAFRQEYPATAEEA
ncbi:MAG: hypothetical protein ACT4PO_14390 [Actinomycetota bacterium]